MKIIFSITFLLIGLVNYAQCNLYGKVTSEKDNSPLRFAKVKLTGPDNQIALTDEFGRFYLEELACGSYQLEIRSIGYKTISTSISLEDGDKKLEYKLSDTLLLSTVDVNANNDFSSRTMRTVEEMILTHGKKTQLIELENIIGNKSNNNARELFATVPGLNIWESDGGGLQLGIGARGLSPNRTAHFNTRQNGYDISADALGYPETYYTPPAEAIKNIQLIRGAASLQFGPQFGGMLNFDLIKPSSKSISYQGSQTYGAYNLFSTFNSISGTLKKRVSYLAYYKYKQGDGWRDNSEFSQHNVFSQLRFNLTENMSVSAEYTYMSYLAKQAGGLTDAMFTLNPQQSIRDRNWFAVNWNLMSFNYNWEISPRAKLDLKLFKVIASRRALGNLDKITRLDDLLERDLIVGEFNNFGAELRYLQHFPIGKKLNGTLAAGLRYYQGITTAMQGLADDGAGPNFSYLNPSNLEGSSYSFPSLNYSAFVENMIRVNDKLWISAGLRNEYILTKAEGKYRVINYHPLTGEVLYDSTFSEQKSNSRNIILFGIGATYKVNKQFEMYYNIAQNYRGINFSDIRINNPNMRIDPDIQDERGFNTDLGFRGKTKNLQLDAGIFFLYYNNKIGLINEKINDFEFVRLRTNIGAAYSSGIETYFEYQFKKTDSSKVFSSIFFNGSYVYARYGKSQEEAYSNKQLELVPPFSIKTGYKLHLKDFTISYLFSYVQKHFTDGTNAQFDPNAVAGLIPSYFVMDFGMNYKVSKNFSLKGGINNFTNNTYYTRRAAAYPGPGIIPSDGISFYLTLDLTF